MIQAYEFAIEKIGLDYASHPVSYIFVLYWTTGFMIMV